MNVAQNPIQRWYHQSVYNFQVLLLHWSRQVVASIAHIPDRLIMAVIVIRRRGRRRRSLGALP